MSVETPVARQAETHRIARTGDVMRMERVATIEVAPGQRLAFKPGGLHVMLLGLKTPLRKGESFPMTFLFSDGVKVTINFPIMGLGARRPME